MTKEDVFKFVPYHNRTPAGRRAIADALGIGEPTDNDLANVSRHLGALRKEGKIEKIGDKRGATWRRKAAA